MNSVNVALVSLNVLLFYLFFLFVHQNFPRDKLVILMCDDCRMLNPNPQRDDAHGDEHRHDLTNHTMETIVTQVTQMNERIELIRLNKKEREEKRNQNENNRKINNSILFV